MFRPTHFVILFAVVLCATAFPAGPGNPTPIGPGRSPEIGPSAKQLAPNTEKNTKHDLDTDASTYDWGYRYAHYTPKWGYGPGTGGETHGWGFGKAYVPDHPVVVIRNPVILPAIELRTIV